MKKITKTLVTKDKCSQNVYSSITDNCQNMEAAKVSINTVSQLSHVLFTIHGLTKPGFPVTSPTLRLTQTQVRD